MSNVVERRSFVIEELLRVTEIMIEGVTFGKDEEVEEAVRQRATLFSKLTDLQPGEVSAQQNLIWMRQLKHLQGRDEHLRELMLNQLKFIRRDLNHAHAQKKEILGDIVRGQRVEVRA